MVHAALRLLQVLRRSDLPGRPSEIHVDPMEGTSFFLEGFPVRVRVGWRKLEEKVERLERVFPRLAADPDGVVSVDLRFQGQVVVETGGRAPRRISSRGRLHRQERRHGTGPDRVRVRLPLA